MSPDTLLYRQIHPSFIQNGRPTSQAFRPTPKDDSKLSVYDGDKIKPKAAWEHYTRILNLSSAGVMAVTNADCAAQQLVVNADGTPYPEHCSVDFSGLAKNAVEKAAKILASTAMQRGWLYQDSPQM